MGGAANSAAGGVIASEPAHLNTIELVDAGSFVCALALPRRAGANG
jgi:hypothetical protein